MKYVITGGTGFIGSALVRSLAQAPCEIVVLTRRLLPEAAVGEARIRFVEWDARAPGAWCSELDGADAVFNLAGKSLLAARWTDTVKQDLTRSRIDAVRMLVGAMNDVRSRPAVFISASAVGYYGDCGERDCAEDAPPGGGFLSELTVEWEEAAAAATACGVRVAMPRIAIALDRTGGALPKMALPFYAMVGGVLGSGAQYLPWIHMADLVRALEFPVGRADFAGPYNCCAPVPVTMNEFCAALGRALHRPSWTNVPSFVLKAVLGEASAMLLSGQKLVPHKLCTAGFQFHYENVDDALYSLYHT